jgi:hypothetical protein
LDILLEGRNLAAIALLEGFLKEPERTSLLAKAREINDANHAIAKAKVDAQRNLLTSAPPCFQLL